MTENQPAGLAAAVKNSLRELTATFTMVSPIALVLARKWMAKGMTRQG